MSTGCVADIAGFHALGPEWRALHAQDSDLAPFRSWEWLFSWWLAYGNGRPLRLVTFRADGRLVGVAPLYVDRGPGIARVCRVLRFVGDGSFDSDYLAVLAAPGWSDRVIDGLCAWLSASRDWDAVELRELSGTSTLPDALLRHCERTGLMLRIEHGRSAALDLPGSFDDFLRGRAPRFRTRLRGLLKRVDAGELVFEDHSDARTLRARLRSLYALHQARWQAAGGTGVFAAVDKRRFYAHFVPRFLRNGWLRLYSLRRGDTYVAHQLCFGGAGITYLLQEGFDVTDPSASYGQMLRAAVVRDLIRRGEKQYDFLGGFSRHKEDWGALEGTTSHVVMARGTLRGRLHFELPALRERAGVLAKRLLPASAVHWLRARIARGA